MNNHNQILAIAVCVACACMTAPVRPSADAADAADAADDSKDSFGLWTGTLSIVADGPRNGCWPDSRPWAEVVRLDVRVSGPSRETGQTVVLAQKSENVESSLPKLVLADVPFGIDNVVTVTGYSADSLVPSWFGRQRDVAVTQGSMTEINVVLTKIGEDTCLTTPATLTQRVFPATAVLGDGRVLVTGGFSKSLGQADGSFEWVSPEKNAYLYDPSTGAVTEVGSMTSPRAGHGMVYVPLPDGEKVLVFGGVNRATFRSDLSFPLSISTEDSLSSYEVFDVASKTFLEAGNDYAGRPKQMLLPRAFPSLSRLFDNTVLVTGGGRWPLDTASYATAELWAPYGDKDENGANPRGGLLDLRNGLAQNRQHAGATVVKLEDTPQGLSRFLIVGGTTNSDAVVEIYTQSSRQDQGANGAFRSHAVSGLPLLYFPSVTSLPPSENRDKKFLVVGGAIYNNGKLAEPQSQAWILTVNVEDNITAEVMEAPCASRFFHQAAGSDKSDRAVLMGGYKDFSGAVNGDLCGFDFGSMTFTTLQDPGPGFGARVGFVLQRLDDDRLLVVGGTRDKAFQTDPAGVLSLYTPPNLEIDLAQP